MNISNDYELAGRSVLVTGATGFVGSHLTRKLLSMGCEVTIVKRSTSNPWRLADIYDRLQIVQGDLKDLPVDSRISPGLEKVEFIFHLAAAGVDQSQQDSCATVETNVLGTLRLLQWARNFQISRFIYCGSCFEYGAGESLNENLTPEPLSEYGASKSAAWLLANAFFRRYELPVVSLRPFTIFGPYESLYRLVPQTILKGLQGGELAFTGGMQTRDFVYIEDAIEAFLLGATVADISGKTFNVATGRGTSVKDIVNLIIEMTGTKATSKFGVIPYRDNELWNLSGDPSQAANVLGWSASHSVEQGMQKTVEWYKLPSNQSFYR